MATGHGRGPHIDSVDERNVGDGDNGDDGVDVTNDDNGTDGEDDGDRDCSGLTSGGDVVVAAGAAMGGDVGSVHGIRDSGSGYKL